MTSTRDLAEQLAAESARLDAEVREIDLLVSQARNEAGRHETRRAAAAEKLAGLGSSASAREALDLANQTVTLTRRAALMDAQVEILEAKKKALLRLRESIDDHAARARALVDGAEGEVDGAGGESGDGRPGNGSRASADDASAAAPMVSRIILTAQEDLRREIARAMHDGPAQSLTNIVLQAEIVERLMGKNPAAAEAEVHQLVAMVQQTLEATKTFIFDVRPMVLDDLGLVPTLRRAARDRGRRAGVAVEFESLGMDQRLPVELESGLFRILDEALAGYLAARPERVSLRLDWGDDLEAQLSADRAAAAVPRRIFRRRARRSRRPSPRWSRTGAPPTRRPWRRPDAPRSSSSRRTCRATSPVGPRRSGSPRSCSTEAVASGSSRPCRDPAMGNRPPGRGTPAPAAEHPAPSGTTFFKADDGQARTFEPEGLEWRSAGEWNRLRRSSRLMTHIQSHLATLRRDDSGQGLAEYALILALIAIVAIVALIFLGTQISGILSTVGASI
ncbi:MAG: hypothetical protein C0498_09185 [Anaerolinea sp.]|nr:hypothetical protein [Anaerolinea sp.]